MKQSRIVPRKMDFDFDPERTPRYWFANNPYLTHFANGMHLLFPEGERFFIRSVKHYADRIRNPALKSRLHAFFAQEAQHGKQHALSFQMLQAQGYDVQTFLDAYEKRAFPIIEKVLPPIMCLSVTVALEHLTATLGANALTDPFIEFTFTAEQMCDRLSRDVGDHHRLKHVGECQPFQKEVSIRNRLFAKHADALFFGPECPVRLAREG